jgi:hypothetical protein
MKGDRCRLDGDTTGSFSGKEVGHGGSFIDISYSSCVATVVEHTLSGRCFTLSTSQSFVHTLINTNTHGIDVSNNANVTSGF